MKELKKLFDSCASSYDEYMESKGLYKLEKKILKKILPLINNRKILDLGCGTGELSIYISKNTNAEVVGIDISPKMIDIANKKKEKYNLQNVSFYSLDIYGIPTSWKFDFIIGSFILGYLRDKYSFIKKIDKICEKEFLIIGAKEESIKPEFDTFKPISLNPNKTQQNPCLNPDFFIGKIFVLTFLR